MGPRGRRAGRRSGGARRGNALLEFVLTLPIIIFMAGLTIYMAKAMLTRQTALVEARHHLFDAANGGWSPMILPDTVPVEDPVRDHAGDMPRGTGEELDRLKSDVESPTLAATPDDHGYWQDIWDNLPGRHHTHQDESFKVAKMWNFIDTTASADFYRDSSSWHFNHLDAWRIARSGPLKEIFNAFHDNLPPDVPAPFKQTRDDIFYRWWHGGDLLSHESYIGSNGILSGG
jgi:hypothetical protein